MKISAGKAIKDGLINVGDKIIIEVIVTDIDKCSSAMRCLTVQGINSLSDREEVSNIDCLSISDICLIEIKTEK